MAAGLRGISIANDAAHRAQAMNASTFNSRHIGAISFKKSEFGLKSNKVFQTNNFNRFKDDNKDLLHVISKSKGAQNIYSKKTISSRTDLVKVIAEAAHDQLKGESKDVLTQDKLEQDPFMASLIALNTGGITDVINQDKANAEMVLDTSADFKKDATYRLAEKAANLFEKGHALNDEEFFKENTKAAIYVIKNQDVVRDFTETEDGKQRAEKFKNEVNKDVNKTLTQNATNSFIQDTLQSATYNADFLNSNPDFTNYLAASIALEDQPTAAEVLKKNPHYNLKNPATNDHFNYDDVTRDIVAKQVFEKIRPDSELKVDDLKIHTGLARLISKNVSLQEAFKKDDVQSDLGILLNNQDPKIETPMEKFQKQFQSTLKERTLVSILA